jgi:hypothetical protein
MSGFTNHHLWCYPATVLPRCEFNADVIAFFHDLSESLHPVQLLKPGLTRRGLLAVILTVAMLCANLNAALAHLPNKLAEAELDRHAQLQMEIAEHGHSHDDGFDEEQHPGHHHGHDAADHSHDVPNMLSDARMPGQPAVRDWQSAPPGSFNPDPAFRLKRQPRVT